MRLRVRVRRGTAVYRTLEAYPSSDRAQMLVALAEAALGSGAATLADAALALAAALAQGGVQSASGRETAGAAEVQRRTLSAAWE